MSTGATSSHLLLRLRDTMAEATEGQERLNKIVSLIAGSLGTEVCSIYLRREDRKLELCATEGLSAEAVHQTVMGRGEGLVGRVAEKAKAINTQDASNTRGFSYKVETGEELYNGFCGVPIQRLGRVTGVLVVQTLDARLFTADEVAALEIVAIVLAEMTELGAFVAESGGAMSAPHQRPLLIRGVVGQDGVAEGTVFLHNPNVTVVNPVADDPGFEKQRLDTAFQALDKDLSRLGGRRSDLDDDTRDILETFESFSKDRGFRRRLDKDIDGGLSAEAAVEIEQSRVRARMQKISDPYIRERMADIDDLSNRLLRHLVGVDQAGAQDLPDNAVLVARNLGPAELLEYGRKIKAVVLSEGSVGSHAAIVARAWSIPLVIQAKSIHFEARNGDRILVDGEQGLAHLRPDESVAKAFGDKIAMSQKTAARYAEMRELPAVTQDGIRIKIHMNAGLIVDLPSLQPSGAEGVGLFRTELQFLTRQSVPKRSQMADLYSYVMDAAGNKPVTFRTLDIGSDKVLPFMQATDEPNPAMGWRAIRMGLDRQKLLKMQIQCLLRGAKGRNLRVMFPFVAQRSEFDQAKAIFEDTLATHINFRHLAPKSTLLGAMLETPSLAYAPDAFFQNVDFISVGGNDLKQFFFAADRENERVRRRYDTLNTSYLSFLSHIMNRCQLHGTPASFCGEDAGRPLEALAFAAMGFRFLSMRPASIGAVKHLLRQVKLNEINDVISKSMDAGDQSVRRALVDHLSKAGITYHGSAH